MNGPQSRRLSRRDFLKATAATAALATTAMPLPIAAQDDPVSLQMWSNFSAGSALEAVDVMVASINEQNPDIVLEHTGFQNEDYKATILNTAFAGGAPPDIFASVGFEWLFAFVRPGAVLDITDYYEASLRERYIPGIEATYEFQGRYWAVPWRVGSTPFIHYNLNLLDQIGASEDDLATVDGLMGVCEKSLAAGITPIAFGNKGQWNAVHWISNFVKNFMGAERANALFSMREGSWTDADPIAGAQRMMSFVDNGYFGSSVNDDYGVPQQKYYAGETLMLGTGGWEVSGLVRKQADDPDFRGDFTEFPVEQGKPGLGSDWIFWGSLWAASATEDTAAIKARLKVLDALGSAAMQGLSFQVRQYSYAARGAVEASGVEIAGPTAKYYDLYEEATSLLPIPDVAIPTQATATMYEEFQGMLLGHVSVEDALNEIADAIERFRPE